MLHLKLTKLVISPGRNGNYVSALAEEIATTLQIMDDDADIDSAIFKNIYFSFKFRFLQKYFIKISEKVKKEDFWTRNY